MEQINTSTAVMNEPGTLPQTLPARAMRAPMRAPMRVPVRRFSTSVNPDDASPENLDPLLTRKGGKMAHKSILLMAAAGFAFMGYAFNVGGLQTTLDSFFDGINHAAQSQNNFVVSSIITIAPFVGAALAGLVLLAIFRGLFRGAKSASKGMKLNKRQAVTLDGFLAEACTEGIGAKVAREAYRLLTPHYKGVMRAQMQDNLRRDVQLSEHDVVDLYAALLTKADRHRKQLETGPVPETVLELLQSVEKAPVRFTAQHPAPVPKGVRLASFVRPSFKP